MISVTVPGKVMLAGEYTVLAGGQALAATVDRHLTVTVAPWPDGGRVASDLWADERHVAPGEASDEPLLAAVAHGLARFGLAGAAVQVSSGLDVRFGIGSSSALRLGVLLGLDELARAGRGLTSPRPRDELWDAAWEAYRLQCTAQGQASGYDLAAQLCGGLTLFAPPAATRDERWPGTTRSLPAAAQAALGALVHVYVGGAGAPTTPVLRETLAWLGDAGRFARLEAATETMLAAFLAALAAVAESPRDGAPQVQALARAIKAHRAVLAGSPHWPQTLAAGLAALPGEGDTWSFKTTGAGGEDALLLVGPSAALTAADAWLAGRGWRPLAAAFETAGVRIGRSPRAEARDA